MGEVFAPAGPPDPTACPGPRRRTRQTDGIARPRAQTHEGEHESMTQQHDAARTLTRRTLAKGAAWSVPVIAAASAAPAHAASSACTPVLKFSGGFYYNYGTIYSVSGRTTNQYLTVGGQTTVSNLPESVTVQDISYAFWIENRQGQTSSGPGTFWMGNTTASTRSSCTSSGCTATWKPTAGSGFSNYVINTGNNQLTVYPTGETYPSWDINMTWSATKDTLNLYSPQETGCRTFTTGPSDKFRVDYSGVPALSTADVDRGKKTIHTFVEVTARLSDGNALNTRINAVYTG